MSRSLSRDSYKLEVVSDDSTDETFPSSSQSYSHLTPLDFLDDDGDDIWSQSFNLRRNHTQHARRDAPHSPQNLHGSHSSSGHCPPDEYVEEEICYPHYQDGGLMSEEEFRLPSSQYGHHKFASPYRKRSIMRRKTPETLKFLMEKHRENERLRHHLLNEHLRKICKTVPGSAKDGKETKVVMMQRIIAYMAYLENTLRHISTQLDVDVKPSLLLLTSSVKDIEQSGAWAKEYLDYFSEDSRDSESSRHHHRLKLSSPTIDSTTTEGMSSMSFSGKSTMEDHDAQVPSSNFSCQTDGFDFLQPAEEVVIGHDGDLESLLRCDSQYGNHMFELPTSTLEAMGPLEEVKWLGSPDELSPSMDQVEDKLDSISECEAQAQNTNSEFTYCHDGTAKGETRESMQQVPCEQPGMFQQQQQVTCGNPGHHHLHDRIHEVQSGNHGGLYTGTVRGNIENLWQEAIIVSPEQVLPFRSPAEPAERSHPQHQGQGQTGGQHCKEEQVVPQASKFQRFENMPLGQSNQTDHTRCIPRPSSSQQGSTVTSSKRGHTVTSLQHGRTMTSSQRGRTVTNIVPVSCDGPRSSSLQRGRTVTNIVPVSYGGPSAQKKRRCTSPKRGPMLKTARSTGLTDLIIYNNKAGPPYVVGKFEELVSPKMTSSNMSSKYLTTTSVKPANVMTKIISSNVRSNHQPSNANPGNLMTNIISSNMTSKHQMSKVKPGNAMTNIISSNMTSKVYNVRPGNAMTNIITSKPMASNVKPQNAMTNIISSKHMTSNVKPANVMTTNLISSNVIKPNIIITSNNIRQSIITSNIMTTKAIPTIISSKGLPSNPNASNFISSNGSSISYVISSSTPGSISLGQVPSSTKPSSSDQRVPSKSGNKLDLRKSSWMNGFMMYSRLHRKNFIKANPGVHTSTISKLMGETWRTMSAQQQEPYRAQAKICSQELQRILDEQHNSV